MTPDSALAALREAITTTGREELPDLVAELARLDALARLRLVENEHNEPDPEPGIQPAERLIDVDAAAEMLGVDRRWLYDRSDRLPFVRRLGRRTLRFSEPGIVRWLETRR